MCASVVFFTRDPRTDASIRQETPDCRRLTGPDECRNWALLRQRQQQQQPRLRPSGFLFFVTCLVPYTFVVYRPTSLRCISRVRSFVCFPLFASSLLLLRCLILFFFLFFWIPLDFFFDFGERGGCLVDMFSFRRKGSKKPDHSGPPYIRTSPSLPELSAQGVPWPEDLIDASEIPKVVVPPVPQHGAFLSFFRLRVCGCGWACGWVLGPWRRV